MPYMVSLLVHVLVRDGHQVLLTAFVSILSQNNAPVLPTYSRVHHCFSLFCALPCSVFGASLHTVFSL